MEHKIIRATKKHTEICMKYIQGVITFDQAKFLLIYECKMEETDCVYLLDEFQKDYLKIKSIIHQVAYCLLFLLVFSMITTLLLIVW